MNIKSTGQDQEVAASFRHPSTTHTFTPSPKPHCTHGVCVAIRSSDPAAVEVEGIIARLRFCPPEKTQRFFAPSAISWTEQRCTVCYLGEFVGNFRRRSEGISGDILQVSNMTDPQLPPPNLAFRRSLSTINSFRTNEMK